MAKKRALTEQRASIEKVGCQLEKSPSEKEFRGTSKLSDRN